VGSRVAGDIVGYQAGTGGAVEVGVPGPGQVAGVLRVQPRGQRVDVASRAVVLADLPGHQGNLGDDRRDLRSPAGLVAARVEVVGMPGRGQVVVRIRWLVGQPLGHVVRPGEAAQHYDVVRARAADRVEHLLHSGDRVADARASAATQPALPARRLVARRDIRVGLVEQVE